jgi:acetyl-CoA carboxylase carboxyltransferase component
MCGRAYQPRFLFSWPNARSAVMGGPQLAGTMEIVARQAARASGREFDEDAATVMRTMVEQQIDKESAALFLSGRLYDDAVIDPRDTRTVLAIALSTVHSGPIVGAEGYGVFRL